LKALEECLDHAHRLGSTDFLVNKLVELCQKLSDSRQTQALKVAMDKHFDRVPHDSALGCFVSLFKVCKFFIA
jgi:hypothetical protein